MAQYDLKFGKGYSVSNAESLESLINMLSTTRRVRSRETGEVDEEEYENTVMRRKRKAKLFLETVGISSGNSSLWDLMWPTTRQMCENNLQHTIGVAFDRDPMKIGGRLKLIHDEKSFDAATRASPRGTDVLQTILIPEHVAKTKQLSTRQDVRDTKTLFNMK